MSKAARAVVASAQPRRASQHPEAGVETSTDATVVAEAPRRRAARIVSIQRPDGDREDRRRQLLRQLTTSDGRAAIARVADLMIAEGFEFPADQEVQLQLLEHHDEEIVRSAISSLTDLLRSEPPFKKPVLTQRLRRLEEHGDEAVTRSASAELRRSLR